MPRDYKHIKKKNNRPAAGLHNFLPFMTGLSIGLLVAFIVFLHEHQAGGNIGLDSNTQTETGAQPQQPLKKAQPYQSRHSIFTKYCQIKRSIFQSGSLKNRTRKNQRLTKPACISFRLVRLESIALLIRSRRNWR